MRHSASMSQQFVDLGYAPNPRTLGTNIPVTRSWPTLDLATLLLINDSW